MKPAFGVPGIKYVIAFGGLGVAGSHFLTHRAPTQAYRVCFHNRTITEEHQNTFALNNHNLISLVKRSQGITTMEDNATAQQKQQPLAKQLTIQII
jgi:hypothetical protein